MRHTSYATPWAPPADIQSRIESAVRAVLFAREADLHPQMRDRIVAQVLWFCTEVPAKYATRYRSQDAWKRQRESKRVSDWLGYVAHEHVWTRATSGARLLAAPDAEAIREVISGLQGCVVTRIEHDRLKPFDKSHEGWGRYIAAGVSVVDTSTDELVELRSLGATLDQNSPSGCGR